MNVSEFLSLKAEKHTPFGGNQFMSLEWSHPRGRGKPLAQTGFLYGTDYYSGVAPGRAVALLAQTLAQTGIMGPGS